MFGSTKVASGSPHDAGVAEVQMGAHVVAIGLGLPLVLALAGGIFGGAVTALLGFAVGLAACAVGVLILMLLSYP